jgi:hypothetical protein
VEIEERGGIRGTLNDMMNATREDICQSPEQRVEKGEREEKGMITKI